MASPFIDGFNSGIASGTNVKILTLTTANANDLIAVVSYCEANSVPGPAITNISSPGLSFVARSGNPSAGSTIGRLEIWYALASSPLSSQSITINYISTFDDCSAIVFGISGVIVPTSPLDPSVTILKKQSNSGTFAPSFTVTTTNTDDIEIVAYGSALSTNPTLPAGFTQIATANNGGGSKWSYLIAGYRQIPTPQSAVVVTAGSYNTGSGGEAILDVIAAAGVPAVAAPLSVSKLNAVVALSPRSALSVSKANAYAVLSTPRLEVTKLNSYTVFGTFKLDVSKLSAYAVLSLPIPLDENSGWIL